MSQIKVVIDKDYTHLTRHITRKIAVRMKVEMASVASLLIDNGHLAMIVHPQFTNDNVVHCGGHLLPRVVISVGKFKMRNVNGRHGKIFPTKFASHSKLTPADPALTFAMLS